MLLDEVDEVVVHDQKGMVEKLEKALLRADMQENNQKLSERLSKKTIMDVVEKTFAHKTKDMIVALRVRRNNIHQMKDWLVLTQESLNKDFQEDPVDYGRLFDEDANGDQVWQDMQKRVTLFHRRGWNRENLPNYFAHSTLKTERIFLQK